jgi:putative membrane protein
MVRVFRNGAGGGAFVGSRNEEVYTMKKHLLILGAAPIFALAACGGTDNTTVVADNGDMVTNLPGGEAMGDNMGAMNGMDGNATAAAPMSGQDFASTVAASDAYEIAAGKLAQQKATTKDLKDFGKAMVDDHTKSTDKLKTAAGKASPAITPAPAMTDEQQANLKTLQSATGTAFDTAYKSQQVVAHEKALAALRAYAGSGDVPQLRDFAREAQDVVSKHYDMIKGM